ncbi:odorant receptor 131-2-like [Conger conger]|uniref:odorant receptor 131-2-like n=1 Tax=Conger conger TaxID=82655 RepID=UPI002A5ABBC9|nr:odorant receptor 131-2-like [Conger conger]
MNISADSGMQKNTSFSMLRVRDTFQIVVTKNIIVVILCISINYINGTLVHTFFRHEIFKENPRYILFIHLVLNDMIQLIIAALLHVISYTLFKINVSLCSFLLIIAISTTFNTPLNLAGMAFECYIAVCNPLRHTQICTVSRTYIFISIIWAVGASSLLPDLFVLLATESNEFFLSTIFCNRDPLFHHAFMKKKTDISHAICLSFVWFILVFSYFKILFAAKTVNTDARKARNTILLHAVQLLFCMSAYIGRPLTTLFMYISHINIQDLRFLLYLIIHILPRFFSPILYGLRDKSFRKYFTRYFLCNAMVTCHCKQVSVIKCIRSPRVSPTL